MKKNVLLLLGLAALAMPMVACGGTSSQPLSSAVSSGEETELVQAAKAAASMLNFDTQAQKGLGSRSFKAVAEITSAIGENSYTFEVNYTAVVQTEYAGASIRVENSDPEALKKEATITIVNPIEDPANTASWIVYVLTAHMMHENAEAYSKDFNLRSDPTQVAKIADLGSMSSGDAVVTYGIYVGKYPLSNSVYWVADGKAGITAYNPTVASGYTPVVGDYIRIEGKYSPYSGLLEIGAGCSFSKASDDDPNFHKANIVAPTETVWDGSSALTDSMESTEFAVTGTVTKNALNSSKTTSTIALTVGTGSINVYTKKGSDAEATFTQASGIAVGANITVHGILGCYGDYQIIAPTFSVNS
ncbi:MAG: hypothetical protein LKG11_01995 [Bacilli bacterium]|jgi:hypothetical protein|nr:hypothetical protein [Bacilli bacterium]